MLLYKLDKAVLLVKNNPSRLLSGITTNTLDAKKNAFIDITGRIIATFDQVRARDDEMLIVIESEFYGRVMEHLSRFLKFSKSIIQKTDYSAYFNLDDDYTIKKDEFSISQRKGKIILTKNSLKTNIKKNEFTLFRLDNNLPLQGIDYDREMLLNIGEDYVSFTKGCYLGQEIIARVKFKSKPQKKLCVKYEPELDKDGKNKMTSKAKDKGGKLRGFVFLNTK
jgi:folate-binding protein YgfZ